MVVDLPPMFDEQTMQCIRYAVNEFKVPQLAFMALLKVEGGKPGMKKRNIGVGKKYEFDYGRSQFNSSNIKVLEAYGIRNAEKLLMTDACYDLRVGAWWLKNEMIKCGGLWCGIGNYHTGANPKTKKQIARNRWYQRKVYEASIQIARKYRWW